MGDPERVPLRVRVSFREGPLPAPGVRPRLWAREDVLGEAGSKRGGGDSDGLYVVRHGLDEENPDPAARVGFATVVRASPESAEIEEVVGVEHRAFSRVIAFERTVSGRIATTSRAGLGVVTKGSEALSQAVGGTPGKAIATGSGLVVRGLRWSGHAVRDVVRAVVEAPDWFKAGSASAGAHLRTRRERRALLRGLLSPQDLTREGKGAALFVAVSGLLGILLAGTLAVVFARPDLASAWRSAVSFFGLGLGSTLVFPFFPEFRLHAVAADLALPGKPHVGGALAVLTGALGMTVGAWLVLFLGDEIHGGLRRSVKPGSPMERLLDAAEAFAAKRGFLAAFLLLAIPYGPDTPVFYLLATVKTPARAYLLGSLLGLLVRFTLVLLVVRPGVLPGT